MEYGYQHQEGQFEEEEEENAGPFEGDEDAELEEHPQHLQYEQDGDGDDYYDEREDRPPQGDEQKRKGLASGRDSLAISAAGKLFVGGLSWETSEDTFANYFSKFGEITDSVIMTDRHSGRPRGFGFVTFSDVAVADRVLEEDHVIDGRAVEVKRTVPREDIGGKGVKRTKKIFIGGIPPSYNEDELKEYFSLYGGIIDHQIMLDHKTGRSRGFGFVTFDSEEAVERIFNEGKTHELGGKRVEIKRAEPKRPGGDYGNSSKSQTGFSGGAGGYSGGSMPGGRFGGKMNNDYASYGGYGAYGGYSSYGGPYAGSASGFYGGYSGGGGGGYGYGFGFGGPMMYGGVGSGYGGGSYSSPSGYGRGAGAFSSGKGYGGRSDVGAFGSSKGYPNGGSMGGGYGGGKSYGGNGVGGGPNAGRFHPYRK